MNSVHEEIYKFKYSVEELQKVLLAPSEAIRKEIQTHINEREERIDNLLDLFTPETYEQWRAKQESLQELSEKEYLKVNIDRYGFFVIDGVKLATLNSKSSKDGELLKLFHIRRNQLIPWSDIKKLCDPSDVASVRKNLKRRLKDNMIYAHYEIVKGSGVVFFGLSYEK